MSLLRPLGKLASVLHICFDGFAISIVHGLFILPHFPQSLLHIRVWDE